MKKLQKGFTLAEMLVVLCVIGVISALMISVLGSKIDRNKAIFKKAYSITERTVVELVNDETYYPYDFENFGFKETTDVKIVGADYYTSTTNYNKPKTKKGTCTKTVKFCNLFTNNLNLEKKPTFNSTNKCSFATTDGITWTITGVSTPSRPVTGFLIAIDTNGDKAPNKPSKVADVSSAKDGKVKNRDRFYIYVRDDGKMQLPDDDSVAKEFIKSSNMNKE